MVTAKSISQALRRAGWRHPGAEEGIACEGTALESVTVRAKNKAFLFVRATEARLKLRESRAKATALAAKDPARYGIGANGWVLIRFGDGRSPQLPLMERWIGESYRAVVGEAAAVRTTRTSTRVKKAGR